MPGGKGMPAVSLPIFSCDTASARRTPSLKAAATRSSSMSLSSASRLGSMATRFTSCLQVIVTFTRPAPDWPSTSIVASSSCARFRLSCMACACFIRPASWFFIMVASPESSVRLDRAGDDARGLVLRHQRLHQRVVVDDLFGVALAALALGVGAQRRRVFGHAGLELQPQRAAEQLRQRGLKLVALRRVAQRLALDAQAPDSLAALVGDRQALRL